MNERQNGLLSSELQQAWPLLAPAARLEGLKLLTRAAADEFFLSLNARDQAALLLALPEGERRLWMRLLAPDDAAGIMQAAPAEERDGLLREERGLAMMTPRSRASERKGSSVLKLWLWASIGACLVFFLPGGALADDLYPEITPSQEMSIGNVIYLWGTLKHGCGETQSAVAPVPTLPASSCSKSLPAPASASRSREESGSSNKTDRMSCRSQRGIGGKENTSTAVRRAEVHSILGSVPSVLPPGMGAAIARTRASIVSR